MEVTITTTDKKELLRILGKLRNQYNPYNDIDSETIEAIDLICEDVKYNAKEIGVTKSELNQAFEEYQKDQIKRKREIMTKLLTIKMYINTPEIHREWINQAMQFIKEVA